jgi:hypothetical protein
MPFFVGSPFFGGPEPPPCLAVEQPWPALVEPQPPLFLLPLISLVGSAEVLATRIDLHSRCLGLGLLYLGSVGLGLLPEGSLCF